MDLERAYGLALTAEEARAVGALLPRLGLDRLLEISSYRRTPCLWEREEDAPLLLKEGLPLLEKAAVLPLREYGLNGTESRLVADLFLEFGVADAARAAELLAGSGGD